MKHQFCPSHHVQIINEEDTFLLQLNMYLMSVCNVPDTGSSAGDVKGNP